MHLDNNPAAFNIFHETVRDELRDEEYRSAKTILLRLREELRISRRELARLLGTSEVSLRRHETNIHASRDLTNRMLAVTALGYAQLSTQADDPLYMKALYVPDIHHAKSGLTALLGGADRSDRPLARVPVGIYSYGFVKALRAVLDANGLESTECGGFWDIRRKARAV